MLNRPFNLREISRIATPALISEFLEEALIVTDSILLSYKPTLYLAAVGIIDSIVLIILAYGDALNDSYQNYYARYHTKDFNSVLLLFKKSWMQFVSSATVITGIILLFVHLGVSLGSNNPIIACIGQTIWFIAPLTLLSFISIWLNSFLMGLGKIKFLAVVSLCCVIFNGLTGYILLFKVSLSLTPISIVLLTSALSELLAIVIMWIYVRRRYAKSYITSSITHRLRLHRILCLSSIYPALSNIGFHLGSLVLFLFCTYFFHQNQVALLTLIFAYWGLMQVPIEGVQEISLNYFAQIYSGHCVNRFAFYSKQLVIFCRICCVVLFFFVIVADYIFENGSDDKTYGMIIVFCISLLACKTEILNTSLIVRLRNWEYMMGKIIFGSVAVGLILIGRFIFNIENILVILIPFLIAQYCENIYCARRIKTIWGLTPCDCMK